MSVKTLPSPFPSHIVCEFLFPFLQDCYGGVHLTFVKFSVMGSANGEGEKKTDRDSSTIGASKTRQVHYVA